MIIVDINDIAVRVFDDGRLAAKSPGYITVDGKDALIGEEAMARAKLEPLKTETRFWEKLSQDELERPSRIARYQADLAYRHLQAILADVDARSDLLFTVPADFTREQVALLLGIGRSLDCPARAVVDGALAAATVPAHGRRLLHLDMHLHRIVVSELEQGPNLERTRTVAEPNVGQMRIRDAWAHAIAARFVSQARFDPMDHASTEQALYDQLGGWMDRLAETDELGLNLKHAGKTFETTVRTNDLIEAARTHLDLLVDTVRTVLGGDSTATLLVSDRATAIPGVRDALRQIPHLDTVALQPEDTARGAKRILLERPDGDSVPFVTRKPWLSRTDLERHEAAALNSDRRAATHWVAGGIARPVGTAGFALRNGRELILADDEVDVQLEASPLALTPKNGSVRLNGAPLTRTTPVFAGDRLRWPEGEELQFIAVESDGTPN